MTAGLGGVPLNQKIGAPKNTAITIQCFPGMNMPSSLRASGAHSLHHEYASRIANTRSLALVFQ